MKIFERALRWLDDLLDSAALSACGEPKEIPGPFKRPPQESRHFTRHMHWDGGVLIRFPICDRDLSNAHILHKYTDTFVAYQMRVPFEVRQHIPMLYVWEDGSIHTFAEEDNLL
jgi:hypothetical protein